MAFDVGSVVAKVTADIGDFKSKMKDAENSMNGLKDGLGKVGGFLGDVSKQSSILAGVVGGGLVLGIKSSIDAFEESQNSIMQQEAVLKSTHGAAGLFIEDLNDQAMALQRLTPFSDEAVRSVQNMLLTFTDVKGSVMQDATGTVLDMAQALGEDTKNAAIQLGKALNDPITGVTALKRVGVTFNATQMDTIKSLQEGGHMAEAQRIVLAELSKEFGGSATTAGKTFAGQMTIMKNLFGELQEVVGGFIIGGLTPLVQGFTAFVTSDGVVNFVNNLTQAFGAFFSMVGGGDSKGFETLMKNLGAPGLIQPLEQFAGVLRSIGEWIGAHKELVLTFLEGLGVALGVLLIVGTITALVMAFTNPLVLVALAIAALFTAYQTNFFGIRDITNEVVGALMKFFNDVLMPGILLLVKFFQTHWLEIQLMTDGVWKVIKGLIEVAWALIYGILSIGIALLSGNWKKAWEDLKNMMAIAWDGIKNIFSGALEFLLGWGAGVIHNLVSPFEDAWNKISALVNKIKDALDFTKRHSPSILDIVQNGVRLVNRAWDDLSMPVLPSTADVGASLSPIGNGGIGATSIAIDLSGAIISDEAGAQRVGEIIGDSIIKKLQQNVRF